MERTWFETIRLLGLDVMVVLVLLGLVVSALWRLLLALTGFLAGLLRRRPRLATSASPRDVSPTEDWGHSRWADRG